MQTSNHQSLHSDLPETVPESEVATFKFSVPDRTPPYATAHALPDVYPTRLSTTCDETEKTSPRPGRWTRWPLLLFFGLLLATLAGVAGGFIGKTLESRKRLDTVSGGSESCSISTSTPPSTSTSPSPTTASTSTSTSPTPLFQRTLAQPSTGCSTTSPYGTFKSVTLFLEAPYTTLCGQGWLNSELIALSAATPSDCVEACVMYNAHKNAADRECVGGGFIPAWWNQTKAMEESGGMAYNCFLKSNASGIARNNKAYEVVALCVAGGCGVEGFASS
ncbi:hypothetical protein EKO04_006840 [Ascochyta lentis]|uniref:Uncharacterized protein n=1 Tax=Ascochyta lentis TaxID=205686 RepID=A0A8H7IY03_9PLEO|nr:hypothetical protein EKO04_006840 [Ascochyta lentis]